MKNLILKIGHWFFRYRDYTPIPLILLLIYVGNFNFIWFSIAIGLTIIGETIRVVAVAYIGGISRTRKGSVDELVTSGPFNCVRNPLYIGNFILSLGFSCLSGKWWFLIIFFIMFFVQYIPIVLWEEDLLIKKFGEEYLEYQKHVPRFLPKFNCKGSSTGKYNFKKAFKSEKSTLRTVIALFIIMSVKFFFWTEIITWIKNTLGN
ncbi:isoprenylcysteine carboxylmethyltransferase family protein [Candidatus Dependentiae bacterium]|nr:isoprenylcysteine carboxylmethyltransferase family protein [Candidatus Dependentiae bacterium]